MLQNHLIGNLYDYVTGVEVGLGSNGRKNRGGHQMEDLVESFLKKSGVEYYKEMYLHEIEKKWGVDLSAISAEGTSTKRWDFVVKTANKIYVIETNFYTGGGSKLNETARSYKMISEESKSIKDVDFIWITDGAGWISARRNLEETFNTMDYIFNIADMENGTLIELFKN
jgi:type II restriction enzyme